MRKINLLLAFVLTLAIASAAQQDVVVLNLAYANGNISVESMLQTRGTFYPPANPPSEGYNLSIISLDEKVLYSQLFEFPLEFRSSLPGSPDQTAFMDEARVELLLPYYDNAAYIKINNKSNVEILSIALNNQIVATGPGSIATTANTTSVVPCILVSCTYSPKTCPKWGVQERSCLDSCTNKKVKEEVNCTPGARVGTAQETGFWQKIGLWFKNIFN